MNLISYPAVEKFWQENNNIFKSFSVFLGKIIAKKMYHFGLEELSQKDFDLYLNLNIIKAGESDALYEINYKSLLVQNCLLKLAFEKCKISQLNNFEDIENLIKNYTDAILYPQANYHWLGSSDILSNLEDFCFLYLHENQKVDIISFLLQEKSQQRRTLENRHIITNLPFIELKMEDYYDILSKIILREHYDYEVFKILESLVKLKPTLTEELYKYTFLKENYHLASVILIKIYPLNESKYWEESLNLLNLSEKDGFNAIAWFEYSNIDALIIAHNTIIPYQFSTIEAIRLIPRFVFRVVQNKNNKNNELIQKLFYYLFNVLSQLDDEPLLYGAKNLLEIIDDFDKEKYSFISLFLSKSIKIQGYFGHFKSSNYLFELLKSTYLQLGIAFNLDIFENDLHMLFSNNNESFKNELLEFISSEIPIIGYGGVQILAKFSEIDLDFIKLNDLQQKNALVNITLFFNDIEKNAKYFFSFKNSKHVSIKELLKEKCIDLVNAYDYRFVELSENYLDSSITFEAELIDIIQKEFKKNKEIREKKSKIKELSPMENDYNFLFDYYRIRQEQMAELQETTMAKSPFLNFGATRYNVIMGSGFKTEFNDTITTLQSFSNSIAMDRRYYINPDKYNSKITNLLKQYKSK